jgi:hypothetical protein
VSRFPSMGMRALRAKHPNAEKLAQIRIFDQAGNVIELEGPITKAEARAIVDAAIGGDRSPHAKDQG